MIHRNYNPKVSSMLHKTQAMEKMQWPKRSKISKWKTTPVAPCVNNPIFSSWWLSVLYQWEHALKSEHLRRHYPGALLWLWLQGSRALVQALLFFRSPGSSGGTPGPVVRKCRPSVRSTRFFLNVVWIWIIYGTTLVSQIYTASLSLLKTLFFWLAKSML